MSDARGGEAPVRRAMILAAGFGTRLRPLTDRLPKPLVPVLGRPLLEWITLALCRGGARHVAVNAHHLPEALAAGVARAGAAVAAVAGERNGAAAAAAGGRAEARCDLALYREPQILGTGGALVNARAFLEQDDAFFLHNGDVLTDLDLGALATAHRAGGALATLALVDWPEANTVLLGRDGAVLDINGRHGTAPDGGRALCYTGVAVLSREVFRYLPEAGYASLIEALLTALAERPGSVRGFAPEGLYWNDLGTVARLLEAHRDILAARRFAPPGATVPEGPVFLGEGAAVDPDARVTGFLSAGRGARVAAGARLHDCVVLDGVTVEAGPPWRRAVLGPGWAVDQDENEIPHLGLVRGAGLGPDLRVERLVEQGSDRTFWRLRAPGAAAPLVLMRMPPDDPDLPRFIAVARFLHERDLGGPALVAADPAAGDVLMEDLGGESLFAAARADRARYPELARAALDLLVDLQTRGTASAPAHCPEACDRLFDHDTLRWESDYFRQRLLAELAGAPAAEAAALDDEFERLARATLAQPVALMHRDFQSQNILFKDGRPRLIDFQGMRRGPLLYDVMSLLRDPYLDPAPAEREPLLAWWARRLRQAGGPALAPDELRRFAAAAGLQRNLQALGAYAFLSRVKGKAGYARWIPAGLRQLADGLREARACGGEPGPLPHLEEAVARLLEDPRFRGAA